MSVTKGLNVSYIQNNKKKKKVSCYKSPRVLNIKAFQ